MMKSWERKSKRCARREQKSGGQSGARKSGRGEDDDVMCAVRDEELLAANHERKKVSAEEIRKSLGPHWLREQRVNAGRGV